MLSQFTREAPRHRTLAEFGLPPRVYAVGRLDRDSEGLLLLSDEPQWNARLLQPGREHPRTYWAQVEGTPSDASLHGIRQGLRLKDGPAKPALARLLGEPDMTPAQVPPRSPPIRMRQTVPTTWIELVLTEGRNRQVRRMTAAVGYPTLRLMRVAIGRLNLFELALAPGCWRQLAVAETALLRCST